MSTIWLRVFPAVLALSALQVACRPADRPEISLRWLAPGVRSQDLSTLRRPPLGEIVVADDAILGYDAASHCLVVTETAWRQVTEHQVPVSGVPLALCLDDEPVVIGALWTPISSLAFDGVVIMAMFSEPGRLCLEWGYPGPLSKPSSDPRDDARLLRAFRDSGRLR